MITYYFLNVQGYEYDSDDNCIIIRKKSGEVDQCRPLIDCQICRDVHEIDIISAEEMTQELFIEKYDLSGRPVLGWSQAKCVYYLSDVKKKIHNTRIFISRYTY